MYAARARDVFLWGYEPVDGDIVLDIGAGIGSEVQTFSECVGGTGRVVAVEAHPGSYAILVENIKANQLSNVAAVQLAIEASEGSVTISNDAEMHRNTILSPSTTGVSVPSSTLDSLVQTMSLKNVGLIKMNIEGAEVAALEGALMTLSITENVCISCHDFKADRTGHEFFRTKSRVVDILRGAGFLLSSRPDAPEPWVRDYVYGRR